VFIKNKDKTCKSIDSAIRITDLYCEQLGLKNELSHMTKYRTIDDLIKSNIFIHKPDKISRKIKLSKKIDGLITKNKNLE